ncbi:MAG: PD40 domain-containing protein [Actinobacteria bacterium]|nr:PD40 domain-containing protein [Actinomycetota bacterium]MBV8396808.1 PD40 domain-containing protein [Actinomycetota bacterium]
MRRALLLAAAALAFAPAASAATSPLIAYDDEGGALYVTSPQATNTTTLFSSDGSETMQALDVSPDGKTVLALDSGDTTQIVLVPIAGGSATPVAGTTGADFGSFSTDGSQVVFSVNAYSDSSLDAGIYTVATGGGTPKLVVASPSGAFDSLPAFSPDGKTVAFVRDTYDSRGVETSSLDVVAASGGTPTTLTTDVLADLESGGRLAFSPDGSKIAYAGAYDNPGIFTVAVGGGSPTQLTSDYDYWPSFSADGSKVFFARDATSDNADDNQTHPVSSSDNDVYELWTVRSNGTSAAVVAQGDFESPVTGSGNLAAAAAGGGSTSATSPPASTPTTTTTPTTSTTPTTTTTPTAAPSAPNPIARPVTKAAAATRILVRVSGSSYLVTWNGRARAWKVTLHVGRKTETAIVKGSLRRHAFVLHGAKGAIKVTVVPH